MRPLLLLFFGALHLSLSGQVASIPFEEDGLVFIEVQLPEVVDPLHFVFDTGASTAVLDSNIAQRLNIKHNFTSPATGAAGSQMYQVATGQTLSIQGIPFSNVNLVFVDLNDLSKRSGRQIDGIIGYDVLKKYITRIDFDTKMLQLFKQLDDIDNISEYSKHPIKMRNSIPEVSLMYTLHDGTKLIGDFLFDSGAYLTMLFNTPYAQKHSLKSRVGTTIDITSRGLTAESTTISGTMKQLNMFGHSFIDIPIGIAQAKAGVSAYKDIAGILGARLIHRFNVILDYANNSIYLKPNTNYTNTFEFPLKGFAIENENGKIKVHYVIKGSDAYAKGIREGDQLLTINGQKFSNLQAYRAELKKEKKTVRLQFLTARGVEKNITLTLKRMI